MKKTKTYYGSKPITTYCILPKKERILSLFPSAIKFPMLAFIPLNIDVTIIDTLTTNNI